MERPFLQNILRLILGFLGVFLGIRYILPLALPFLLGAGLAAAAEPAVHFGEKRLRLRRGFATALGVSITLLLGAAVVVLLAALLVRELTLLAGVVPNVEQTVRDGMRLLERWLLGLAEQTPEGIRGILSRGVSDLFTDGTDLVDQAGRWVLSLASSVLVRLPDSALGLGTFILAGYMISAKLPGIRRWVKAHLPERWFAAWGGMKQAVWGWCQAQAKLAGITFCIMLASFLALRIKYAPVWALITALVDAVPLLGTGTVLLPWSLVCFLKSDPVRGVALLAIYAVSAVTRSALEPRLVGKKLGLDPLLTLAALYTGFQLWGIGGMILSPILSVAAVQMVKGEKI